MAARELEVAVLRGRVVHLDGLDDPGDGGDDADQQGQHAEHREGDRDDGDCVLLARRVPMQPFAAAIDASTTAKLMAATTIAPKATAPST